MEIVCKRFFPVIHCISPLYGGIKHAQQNSKIAFENGADGVFLIGHTMKCGELLAIYQQVRLLYPEKWIGINFLDIPADRDWSRLTLVVRLAHGLNGLWMDALPIATAQLEVRKGLELFGGVAFKYIDPGLSGERLQQKCAEASVLVHTVTTSGNETGSPPEVSKLKVMRAAVGPGTRLALASGVCAENVRDFLPYVDTFLVASSITVRRNDLRGQEYLVPEKVLELRECLRV